MRKEIITESEFTEIIRIIEECGAGLVIAEMPYQKFYLHNGERLSKSLDRALQTKYPGLDEDDRSFFCHALCNPLEKSFVMLRFFENKDERDHIVQKVLIDQPGAQDLLKDSGTRAANIRNIYYAFELIFLGEPPKECRSFINAIKQRYGFQLKTSSETERIENACRVRELVYDFIVKFIA